MKTSISVILILLHIIHCKDKVSLTYINVSVVKYTSVNCKVDLDVYINSWCAVKNGTRILGKKADAVTIQKCYLTIP